MTARVHRASFIALMTVALLAAGCGSGRSRTQTRTRQVTGTLTSPATPAPLLNPDQPIPTPGPTGVPAAAATVDVIRAWSDALRRGDVMTAAGYFALPSVMVNGTGGGAQALIITIGTRADAEAANETLPCGAKLISADQRGRYVNALFRLTGRVGPGGTDCGGGGSTTARTNFVIAHGRIVEWLRAPDDPGDNATPRTQPPTPGSPPTGPTV